MSPIPQTNSVGSRSIRLRSLKYDGSLNYEWPARLLWEDPGGFIWHTSAGMPFTRPTGVSAVPYDWVGRVWYDRSYMVDASLLPPDVAGHAGIVHHYYCNLGTPGLWESDVYRYVDLDLDVVIFPDGRHLVVDEDEFAAHAVRFGYSDDVIAATRQAVEDTLALARSGAHPFDGTLAAYHLALYAPAP
jgi:uncharacterized protein